MEKVRSMMFALDRKEVATNGYLFEQRSFVPLIFERIVRSGLCFDDMDVIGVCHPSPSKLIKDISQKRSYRIHAYNTIKNQVMYLSIEL